MILIDNLIDGYYRELYS